MKNLFIVRSPQRGKCIDPNDSIFFHGYYRYVRISCLEASAKSTVLRDSSRRIADPVLSCKNLTRRTLRPWTEAPRVTHLCAVSTPRPMAEFGRSHGNESKPSSQA